MQMELGLELFHDQAQAEALDTQIKYVSYKAYMQEKSSSENPYLDTSVRTFNVGSLTINSTLP